MRATGVDSRRVSASPFPSIPPRTAHGIRTFTFLQLSFSIPLDLLHHSHSDSESGSLHTKYYQVALAPARKHHRRLHPYLRFFPPILFILGTTLSILQY